MSDEKVHNVAAELCTQVMQTINQLLNRVQTLPGHISVTYPHNNVEVSFDIYLSKQEVRQE